MARANVLIIDDEEKIRLLLSRIIKLEGFAVWDAGSLKVGSQILEKQSIDILLCDVLDRSYWGFDLLREVPMNER